MRLHTKEELTLQEEINLKIKAYLINPSHTNLTRHLPTGQAIFGIDCILYDYANSKSQFFDYISKDLFCGCDKIKSITIPEGIKEIEYSAFEGFKNLETVIFPGSIVSIEDSAFKNCSKLQNVTFKNGQNPLSIGKNAFAYTACLRHISFPQNLIYIENHAFSFSGLSDVVFNEGLSTIENGAFSWTKLIKVHIPDTVYLIGQGAFLFCENLSEINIPRYISFLPSLFLANCSVKRLILYNRVKTLEQYCIPDSLSELVINSFDPPCCRAFIPENCLIYVPTICLKKYKSHSDWARYANRIFPNTKYHPFNVFNKVPDCFKSGKNRCSALLLAAIVVLTGMVLCIKGSYIKEPPSINLSYRTVYKEDADYYYNLGRQYLQKNESMALKCWKRGARKGFGDAQYAAGLMYENGKGTKKNLKKAIKYYRMALQSENPEAINLAKERLREIDAYY